jgi:hypothetical protein
MACDKQESYFFVYPFTVHSLQNNFATIFIGEVVVLNNNISVVTENKIIIYQTIEKQNEQLIEE